MTGPGSTKEIGDIVFVPGDISKLQLVTLPAGINLYHGSRTRNAFDPKDIKLSDGTLLAIFSNSPRLASDNFMNCAEYPATNGYLHQFQTKKEVPYIQIISPSTIDRGTSLEFLDSKYCQRPENPRLGGFAYPVKNITIKHEGKPSYDYIIGLCNPNEYLTYVSTAICVNPYRLSNPINIF